MTVAVLLLLIWRPLLNQPRNNQVNLLPKVEFLTIISPLIIFKDEPSYPTSY